ncbi:response regulator [Hyphomicrobium sp. CS1GBMeth3]|uniref:response regulator n=1 Tax=Hyphomicrobium sp. CS1GBMeth3 TaxID=1892845 RepID=UPI0009FA0A95|nr:response regulator [Hyphomicrobium sp. CS1GBMeth3]
MAWRSSAQKAPMVLYVDDEPIALKYFKASIGGMAEIVTAPNPREAYDVLDALGNEITVVVSDERMPVERGVDFLRSVKDRWPSTRRVLTSAFADVENLQRAINEAAIFRFIPKPWDMDQLNSVMARALDIDSDDEPAKTALPDLASTDIAAMATWMENPLSRIEQDATRLAAMIERLPDEQQQDAKVEPGNWPSLLLPYSCAALAGFILRDVRECRSLLKSFLHLTVRRHNVQ